MYNQTLYSRQQQPGTSSTSSGGGGGTTTSNSNTITMSLNGKKFTLINNNSPILTSLAFDSNASSNGKATTTATPPGLANFVHSDMENDENLLPIFDDINSDMILHDHHNNSNNNNNHHHQNHNDDEDDDERFSSVHVGIRANDVLNHDNSSNSCSDSLTGEYLTSYPNQQHNSNHLLTNTNHNRVNGGVGDVDEQFFYK